MCGQHKVSMGTRATDPESGAQALPPQAPTHHGPRLPLCPLDPSQPLAQATGAPVSGLAVSTSQACREGPAWGQTAQGSLEHSPSQPQTQPEEQSQNDPAPATKSQADLAVP